MPFSAHSSCIPCLFKMCSVSIATSTETCYLIDQMKEVRFSPLLKSTSHFLSSPQHIPGQIQVQKLTLAVTANKKPYHI